MLSAHVPSATRPGNVQLSVIHPGGQREVGLTSEFVDSLAALRAVRAREVEIEHMRDTILGPNNHAAANDMVARYRAAIATLREDDPVGTELLSTLRSSLSEVASQRLPAAEAYIHMQRRRAVGESLVSTACAGVLGVSGAVGGLAFHGSSISLGTKVAVGMITGGVGVASSVLTAVHARLAILRARRLAPHLQYVESHRALLAVAQPQQHTTVAIATE